MCVFETTGPTQQPGAGAGQERQQMPGPASPRAPDMSTCLNFDLTAVETGVAEHNAFLRSLNTQVPDIMSGMETLAGVVERLGVKIQEWEDECAAEGEEGPENPTHCHGTTPDANPFNPSQPVKAQPGAPPTFLAAEGIPLAHCPYGDTKPERRVDTQFSALGYIRRVHTARPTPRSEAGAATLLHEAGRSI